MRKKILIAAGLIFVVIMLHFVPVYRRLGYTEVEVPDLKGGISTDLCIAYFKPVNETYRVIPHGPGSFQAEIKHFKHSAKAAHGSNNDFYCATPVDLRLYLW